MAKNTNASVVILGLLPCLDNLDIRCFSENTSGTMRNYVFGKELAINGIKILPETSNEPSYVGTAYVNLEDIDVLSEKFKNMWELAKPLK